LNKTKEGGVETDHLESLYIVMPAYNEEETIAEVVSKWYKVLEGKSESSRLIVADSGSTDRTHALLLEMQSRYPQLVILDNVASIMFRATMSNSGIHPVGVISASHRPLGYHINVNQPFESLGYIRLINAKVCTDILLANPNQVVVAQMLHKICVNAPLFSCELLPCQISHPVLECCHPFCPQRSLLVNRLVSLDLSILVKIGYCLVLHSLTTLVW
jgi:glycosyltransferase involved in cell wall biosynthesis